MKILIAPDKYKGCLRATEVAAVMARVLQKRYPEAELVTTPLTDGGDGFVPIMVAATGGRIHRTRTNDAAGRPCLATWGVLGDGKTAVIGISEASGLSRLPGRLHCAGRRSTVGTGMLIARAVRAGYRRVIIGLGGSATNDGGIGLVAPLGFQFLDRSGASIPLTGFGLAGLHRIVRPTALPRLEVLAATDVTNPLYGCDGAACRYAPQKGATPAEVRQLDDNLRRLSRMTKQWLGHSPHQAAGAGAAGGAGYGLMAFLNAKRVAGFDVFAQAVALEREIRSADLIITGEGRFDATSRFGKGCVALAQLAKKHRRPIWAVCGQIDGAVRGLPFTRTATLVSKTVSPAEAQRFVRRHLRATLKAMVA